MKLVYSQKIAELRGTLSVTRGSLNLVFTDHTPCYMQQDAVVVADMPEEEFRTLTVTKDDKRLAWDAAYVERLIEINRLYPPLATLRT